MVISKVDKKTFALYPDKFNSFKPLACDEERELFRIIENNKASANQAWKKAREKIISSHSRFVVYLARNHLNRGLDLDDLVQEGYAALVKAVDRFNITTGKRFISYASPWINGALKQAIYDQGSLVRVPQYLHKKDGVFLSSNEADNVYFIDSLVSHYRTPEAELIHRETVREINKALNALNKREKLVVKARYLELEDKRPTLTVLAASLEVSHQRVTQIENDALKSMAIYLQKQTA
jgi:RNA polymerase primary sigma factor